VRLTILASRASIKARFFPECRDSSGGFTTRKRLLLFEALLLVD
jgi:hypothetical protein